jgi:23S rRNA (adenine2503-C2)-methyltransferase
VEPHVKKELIGLSAREMERLLAALGEPAYRGRQLFQALYRKRQRDFRSITPFPGALRASLDREFQITLPDVRKEFQSTDGTRRYLFGLSDGREVEAVRMPEPGRNTICVSTQVGCPVDCKFCLTGVMGFTRNLTTGEIIGQVLRVMEGAEVDDSRPWNLVFMGMGEPLLNFASVIEAVRLLADPEGIAMPWMRMTLSTAGVVPGIERLGREPLRPKLAVSLNAPTDELRSRIMPITRKWPLDELLRACREFPLRPREKLTFEYVLLEGVNDSVADARQVAKITRGIRSKVNLIGLNPGPDLPFRTPPDEVVLRFQQTLIQKGVQAFIRKPRGRDIFAACGQLKLMELQAAPANC